MIKTVNGKKQDVRLFFKNEIACLPVKTTVVGKKSLLEHEVEIENFIGYIKTLLSDFFQARSQDKQR